MKKIISFPKSVVVAADVPTLDDLKELIRSFKDVPLIGGVKIGFTLAMQGLERVTNIIKLLAESELPVIYDHQKAGNDIPDMGIKFARALKEAEVDAAILFPFAGPATQEMWTKSCFDAGLDVITGGVMTHPKFLVSEGGYISDEAVERIYRFACRLGVHHFVVPGNKIYWVKKVRGWLVEELGEGNFILYAPGFITQTGDISECGKAAGNEWHAIIGSAIYEKLTREERRQAAAQVTSQIIT